VRQLSESSTTTGVGPDCTVLHDELAVGLAVLAGAAGDRLPHHRHAVGRLREDELAGQSPEQLVAAVRTVAAGEALLAPTITRRLVEEFVRGPRPGDAVPPALAELTDRAREVLELIGAGRSNGEIAAHLVVSGATVKTHVNRIFQKLGLRDRVQAVVLAYESGLVRAGER
jgi:ATP/maltotriose-dependent transcriptional regulator MalT